MCLRHRLQFFSGPLIGPAIIRSVPRPLIGQPPPYPPPQYFPASPPTSLPPPPPPFSPILSNHSKTCRTLGTQAPGDCYDNFTLEDRVAKTCIYADSISETPDCFVIFFLPTFTQILCKFGTIQNPLKVCLLFGSKV